MNKAVYFSFTLMLILGGVAVALWLQPTLGMNDDEVSIRYGRHEGLELVRTVSQRGDETYSVEDNDGRRLFDIPLRGCMLDTRFRQGCLRFRENATGREGYIDRYGRITLTDNGKAAPKPAESRQSTLTNGGKAMSETVHGKPKNGNETLPVTDLRTMARTNPMYKEAAKVLQGKLDETDASNRRTILNYCEHLRTAYTTKDIDFLRQVFSDNALIIVGSVVRPTRGHDGQFASDERVAYSLRTKKEYISRLSKAFAMNKTVDVRFSDFHIMRHPTMNGIYGVSLRQRYSSDRYSDDGYLFLLWDFRNRSMPLIHVRTWQPSKSIGEGNDVITIRDFNLE